MPQGEFGTLPPGGVMDERMPRSTPNVMDERMSRPTPGAMDERMSRPTPGVMDERMPRPAPGAMRQPDTMSGMEEEIIVPEEEFTER